MHGQIAVYLIVCLGREKERAKKKKSSLNYQLQFDCKLKVRKKILFHIVHSLIHFGGTYKPICLPITQNTPLNYLNYAVILCLMKKL